MALLLTRPRSTHKHKAVQAKGSATSSFGTLSLSLSLVDDGDGFYLLCSLFLLPSVPDMRGEPASAMASRAHPGTSGVFR